MYLAYSLLLTLGLVVLIPRFLIQALIHGKYVPGFRERLGHIPNLHKGKAPIIWLHCVSVGETQAARPLVTELRKTFPDSSLVISTITLTGQRLAREVFKDQADRIIYFPFDWRWTVRRTLRTVRPSAVLIMETELWPNFLRECRVRGIPVALVNGRISRQSFRRYRLIRFFFANVLSCLNMAVMQSEADAQRIRALGISPEKVVNGGNLKFDSKLQLSSAQLTSELQLRFAIEPNTILLLAASTHSQEEKIVLDSFRAVNARNTKSVRLMLAPRHPERFREVSSLLQKSGLSWVKRSDPPSANDHLADVMLLDSIGELPAMYSLATIVFVGGSLVDKGGHNVLEPAAAAACIVTGAHTQNFEAIVDLLKEAGALIQLPRLHFPAITRKLTDVFTELIENPEVRKQLGVRAKETVTMNQGAAFRTAQLISPLLVAQTKSEGDVDFLKANNAHN